MAGWSTEDVGATIDEMCEDEGAMEAAAQMLSIVSPLLVHNVQLMVQLTKFIIDFKGEVYSKAYYTGYSEGQENYECDEDHGSYDSGYDSGRGSRDSEVTELQNRIDIQGESIESLEEEVEELREKIKELEDQ